MMILPYQTPLNYENVILFFVYNLNYSLEALDSRKLPQYFDSKFPRPQVDIAMPLWSCFYNYLRPIHRSSSLASHLR